MKKLIIILAMLGISFITNAQLVAYKTVEYSSQGVITNISNSPVSIDFSGKPFNADYISIKGNGYSFSESITKVGKNHYQSNDGTQYYLKNKIVIREPPVGLCQKYYIK